MGRAVGTSSFFNGTLPPRATLSRYESDEAMLTALLVSSPPPPIPACAAALRMAARCGVHARRAQGCEARRRGAYPSVRARPAPAALPQAGEVEALILPWSYLSYSLYFDCRVVRSRPAHPPEARARVLAPPAWPCVPCERACSCAAHPAATAALPARPPAGGCGVPVQQVRPGHCPAASRAQRRPDLSPQQGAGAAQVPMWAGTPALHAAEGPALHAADGRRVGSRGAHVATPAHAPRAPALCRTTPHARRPPLQLCRLPSMGAISGPRTRRRAASTAHPPASPWPK